MKRIFATLAAVAIPSVGLALTPVPQATFDIDPTVHIDPSTAYAVSTLDLLTPGETYAVAISGGPGIGYDAGTVPVLGAAGRVFDRDGTTQRPFALNELGAPGDPNSYWAFVASPDMQVKLWWPSDTTPLNNIGGVTITLYHIVP